MITWGSNTKVYLATGATDMRKAINGLIVLVEDVLQADPFSRHLFVFCNRLRDKIKILVWELCKYCHRCHYARFEIIYLSLSYTASYSL